MLLLLLLFALPCCVEPRASCVSQALQPPANILELGSLCLAQAGRKLNPLASASSFSVNWCAPPCPASLVYSAADFLLYRVRFGSREQSAERWLQLLLLESQYPWVPTLFPAGSEVLSLLCPCISPDGTTGTVTRLSLADLGWG